MNNSIYDLVKISPQPHSKYLLLEDFTYRNITVPKGYLTNGADIPRIFWSLVPPNLSAILPAVILHDYLCDLQYYEKADFIFESCLKDLDVKPYMVKVLSSSVRIYHKIRYRR